MKILFSPQVSTEKLFYVFTKDKITVTYKGITDTFDFTDMPDGMLEVDEVETVLEKDPIFSAKRENGVLWVEVLNLIGEDATEAERFPDWIDSIDYVPPEEEVPEIG